MNNIRVLVANKPRLMRELVVATISDQPDIEIVGQIEEDTEIRSAVQQTQPDLLIVALGESDQLPAVCRVILEDHPHVKIIAIAPHRNSAVFYWARLDIRSDRIETSEEGILNDPRLCAACWGKL